MAFPTRSTHSEDLYKPLANINVTPLVDILLVLLIIFMVTAPMLAKGMRVNLPQAQAARPVNRVEPIVVTIGKAGKIALGAEEVSADALADRVHAMIGDNTARAVFVRGDQDANYGDVVTVVDNLATHGVSHLAILTNSHSKADPPLGAAPAGAAAGRGRPK